MDEKRYQQLVSEHWETQAYLLIILGLYAADAGHGVISFLVLLYSAYTACCSLYRRSKYKI